MFLLLKTFGNGRPFTGGPVLVEVANQSVNQHDLTMAQYLSLQTDRLLTNLMIVYLYKVFIKYDSERLKYAC